MDNSLSGCHATNAEGKIGDDPLRRQRPLAGCEFDEFEEFCARCALCRSSSNNAGDDTNTAAVEGRIHHRSV
jgi:hypothetical protein